MKKSDSLLHRIFLWIVNLLIIGAFGVVIWILWERKILVFVICSLALLGIYILIDYKNTKR